MGKAIDADRLIEWFAPYLHTGEPIPADVVIENIRAMPALPQPSGEPLTQADLNKMYFDEVWLEYPDGSGEAALVVNGKIYSTSSLEGAGLDLEEYIMGETLDRPTGTYKLYRRPPEEEADE